MKSILIVLVLTVVQVKSNSWFSFGTQTPPRPVAVHHHHPTPVPPAVVSSDTEKFGEWYGFAPDKDFDKDFENLQGNPYQFVSAGYPNHDSQGYVHSHDGTTHKHDCNLAPQYHGQQPVFDQHGNRWCYQSHPPKQPQLVIGDECSLMKAFVQAMTHNNTHMCDTFPTGNPQLDVVRQVCFHMTEDLIQYCLSDQFENVWSMAQCFANILQTIEVSGAMRYCICHGIHEHHLSVVMMYTLMCDDEGLTRNPDQFFGLPHDHDHTPPTVVPVPVVPVQAPAHYPYQAKPQPQSYVQGPGGSYRG